MKRFIIKTFLFSLFPAAIIAAALILYFNADVYEDFGKHQNYSWTYHFQQLGDIATKKLLHSNKKYNSFIFGSSRTIGVYACYLQTKIPNSIFFHYGNFQESIGGIYEKLKLIDSLGYSIDNAIIYFDTDFTFLKDGNCRPSDHYLLNHQSKMHYRIGHIETFFSVIDLNKLKILVGQKPDEDIFPNWHSDLYTNDCNHQCSDSIIKSYSNVLNSKEFIRKMDSLKLIGFLHKRPDKQTFSDDQISIAELQYLIGIKKIFEKHSTNFKIIITPLYNQIKFSSNDMKILTQNFNGHLYDFSGINAITENIYNYPDRSHFQPYISKNILDSVLKE